MKHALALILYIYFITVVGWSPIVAIIIPAMVYAYNVLTENYSDK